MSAKDSNQTFRDSVALSLLADARPTLVILARNTGVSYEDVVHHALVRYASSGAEALLAWDPHALRELIAARKAEDWRKVGSIIDWLEAGLEATERHRAPRAPRPKRAGRTPPPRAPHPAPRSPAPRISGR